MKQVFLTLCAFFIIMLLGSSCNSYTKLMKSQSYEQKYEAAKQYYAQGNYNYAATLCTEVLSVLKGTEYGEESLYLTGLSHMRARNYDAAATVFRKYYTTYPKGKFSE